MKKVKLMNLSYTNRRGVTYYLCQSLSKRGKPRYYFARTPQDTPVEQVPEGFRISESPSGRVALERDRPSLILPAEAAAVEAAIARHPKPGDYYVAIKHDWIEINERVGQDSDDSFAVLTRALGLSPQMYGALRSELQKTRPFAPVLRFCLLDIERRDFNVERWCSLGSIDDWIDVGLSGPLNRIVEPAIDRLGDDSFYDVFWHVYD